MSYPYDLGSHQREITTSSGETQVWFNRGLIWIYGFDLEMATRCFRKAIAEDEDCAMAWWGLAYASGIYYNKPWYRMQTDELTEKLNLSYKSAREAMSRSGHVTRIESMMIEALQHRYQSPVPVDKSEYLRWDDDYSNAMRKVYHAFPEDDDVCALHAEALMTRTPWALWDLQSGKPAAGASTIEAMDILEDGISRLEATEQTPHPGMLHMYIHLLEMSPFPERALRACDALRQLVPGSAHLCHMPSHIDVRCGHYYEAIQANNRAIEADHVYLANEGSINYHTLSRIHNQHLKIYAALFLGQFRSAMEAAEEIIATTPEELLRIENPAMADWMEAYIGMKAHVFIRFGKWQEIIDHPLPDAPELYTMTTAVWHYAKTISWAALDNVAAAEQQRTRFFNAKTKVSSTRYLFNNSCLDVLSIAEQMLHGEIEYRKGHHESAYAYLGKAIELEDNLKYDEPWGWMQPARHALGALLLEQGHVETAEQVYRDDLGLSDNLVSTSRHPDNLWSLHGLVECLNRLGRNDEANTMQARLNLAIARADEPVVASCACRLQHHRYDV